MMVLQTYFGTNLFLPPKATFPQSAWLMGFYFLWNCYTSKTGSYRFIITVLYGNIDIISDFNASVPKVKFI